MARLLELLSGLRRDPRLLKLPPYLSALCILAGAVWILCLPLNNYSRRTYISENALLPGQVHTYFAGSEQNIFRAYKKELEEVAWSQNFTQVSDKISSILTSTGLKTATQQYEYRSAGQKFDGKNVYSVLNAPRGDGTEAIVLIAALKTANGELNLNGVALVLTLARYFKRWSLWSKDIIFVLSSDSIVGSQAWVDAYHDTHHPTVESLSLKSGALQGAVVVEYPQDHRFNSLHISYDGINGQLPNLDLVNTAIAISTGQMNIPASIQHMHKHDDRYFDRLTTLLRGMTNQALGHGSGPHSAFMPYHVDAITLTAIGEGVEDEMAFGRVIEGLFRSLNNLLEHFHQSFFFYLLMQTNRFVSIGTYLPSAMLIAGAYSIMAIALWVKSGRVKVYAAGEIVAKRQKSSASTAKDKGRSTGTVPLAKGRTKALIRPLFLVFAAHVSGSIPLYLLNQLPPQTLVSSFTLLSIILTLIPLLFARVIPAVLGQITTEDYILTKSSSLLVLGLFLSALATINFSLSTVIGLGCTPLAFAYRRRGKVGLRILLLLILFLLSPMNLPRAVAYQLSVVQGAEWAGVSAARVESYCTALNLVLEKSAFAWNVWGSWGVGIALWGIWWPAWFIGVLLVASP